MAVTPKLLYQGKPTGSAASVLAGETGKTKIIRQIFMQENTSAVNAVYWYHHNTGTTYDSTTFLRKVSLVADGDALADNLYIVLGASANFALKLDTTLQVTVTIYGDEIT